MVVASEEDEGKKDSGIGEFLESLINFSVMWIGVGGTMYINKKKSK